MSTQTAEKPATEAAPLALHVPETFTYVDRGLSRASDWVEYHIHPGLYRIRFTTIGHRVIPGNTRDEARALADAQYDADPLRFIDRTAGRPYYAVAELTATKVESYYENQLFSAVSSHRERHDDLTVVRWRPYAYEVRPGASAYVEWVGEGTDRHLVVHAQVVELQPCDECEAEAGEQCEEGCQGGWDGIAAANAGSAS